MTDKQPDIWTNQMLDNRRRQAARRLGKPDIEADTRSERSVRNIQQTSDSLSMTAPSERLSEEMEGGTAK
jgi:hypothetical protein